MLPAILAVGTVLRVASQFQGNMAQAQSEMENAKFYEMQAQYAREAMSREASISRRKYAATIGAQKGALAKGGVSLSDGSSLGVLANTLAQQSEELVAIRKKGEMDFNLAKGRAAQARRVSDTLRDPIYNITQAAGTALTAYAMMD